MKTEKWVKENLEAIAIAVVMALVIRQFAIEAFKIPTESMAPTLLGDDLGGTGDRILVDKIEYHLREPERGDVIVFKYPLNASKNYIKRLIGLPGDTVSIRNGDVWINGEIWRKPPHVQEVLFFPVYPPRNDRQARRRASVDWELDEDRWSRADGAFRVAAGEEESLATYGREVRNNGPRSSGYKRVGDVRIRLRVEPEGPGGEVILRIVEGGAVSELRLAVGEGVSTVCHEDESRPLEGVVLEPGGAADVAFSNADDTIRITVDGESFRFEYPSVLSVPDGGNSIRFGVRDTAATFTEVGIDRDIFYTNEGNLGQPSAEVHVPEDCFYALGDNSSSSADSRRWKVHVIELEDGTEIRYDSGSTDGAVRTRGAVPGTEVITDVSGKKRVIRKEDIVRTRHFENAPFVPRENLIGRAFFVFWPINPFKGQFRLKFIR